jgi:hypothetical protein
VADLTVYETQRMRAIARWKGEVPGRVSRALNHIRRPLGRFGARLIPDNVTRKALDSLVAKLDADRQVQIDGEIAPAPPHPRDDALRTLGDLAGHAVYLTSFGVSFGATVPFALAGQAARWLPGPVVRGAHDGARDAVRSVNQLQAGWRNRDDQVTALVPARAVST